MNIIKNFSHTVSIGHTNYDDLTDYDSHLYITSSGTISAPIGSSITMRPHGRDDYHVIYIQKGSMKFKINEIEYDMRAGAFAFINYGSPHEYYCDKGEEVLYHWLHFKGDFAHSFLHDFSLDDSCVYQFEYDEELSDLFKNITYELNQRHHMYLKLCQMTLTEIFIRFSKKIQDSSNAKPKIFSKIEIIQSIMRSHNCVDMSVDDFAQMCHLSKSRFIKKFKQATGYTPIEYRNMTIINKAKWHLRNTTMTVTEISNFLGFINPSYFSTLFRKHTGCTPNEYRKKHLD